ncbi:neurexin-4-like [Rhopilema esculentum]|uniref:neurexin-4-like n=1 Tax=Rhopilema esculentum TaxID=499914 RepID=UPI0031E0FAD3
MDENAVLYTFSVFILIAFALGDSFYYLNVSEKPAEDGSLDSLNIDESFFACDLNPNCRNVNPSGYGSEVGTGKSDWKKVAFRSCSDAMKQQNSQDGIFLVHFDKMGHPVEKNCMKENGSVYEVFDHDSEMKIFVNGYEGPASYQHKIVYKTKLHNIKNVVDASKSCRQFFRIECHGMALYGGIFYGFLVDRNGQRMDYIGGGPVDGRGCKCGITGTCAKAGTLCNCDANDNVMRFDEGYVTDKSRLPITEVRLGDTGSSSEYGAFTIGRLECVT